VLVRTDQIGDTQGSGPNRMNRSTREAEARPDRDEPRNRSKPQKVVITAAGLGTRLLPMTKELPKEMLPLYMVSQDRLILKPLLQALFEQLFGFGMRSYCF